MENSVTSESTASDNHKAGEPEAEVDFVKAIDDYLNPLLNPLFEKLFRFAIVVLILLLTWLWKSGFWNIHVFIMGFLAICLFILVTWWLSELRSEYEKVKAKKEEKKD